MSHHFIRFSDVSYEYPNGVKALDGVNLLVRHGEKVAILGRNGAGKSTLLLHMNGLLLPTSGEVNVGDVPVTRGTLPLVRQSVGMVFQNPDDQLFMPTVEADVAFGPRNMGLDPAEVERRVNKALEATGCTHLRKRAPFELSGGQKKMISIATVLSMSPEILVFDEPTSGLDFEATGQFARIVEQLPQTMLMSSHDMELVHRLCHRAIVMSQGKIVYDGDVDTMPYPADDFKTD